MQGVVEADRGSGIGEMEAGLQMETVALALELGVTDVPVGGGLYCPLVLVSELVSRAGDVFFFAGRALAWPVLCCCCWRHFARRFLNQTCKKGRASKQ